jgi:enamine deaminase RidA (YjgF/YER057c/UK114 family)
MDLEFLNVAAAPPPPPTATRSAPSQVMRNLQTVLAGAGTTLARVVMARVYLTDFAGYAAMNAAYASYFAPGRLPARATVGVTGLALDAAVEIDLIVRM